MERPVNKSKSTDFLKTLEDAVISVLNNPEATPVDKMKAVAQGIVIQEMRDKAKGEKNDRPGKHFFRG
jgi:lipoate-protein ligase B